ncbi:acetoacetate-CoA ligase [Cadophora sp. DSE1049]|nr:acetoacetate-CoA ligase [Cadophora sp. DSE1049]
MALAPVVWQHPNIAGTNIHAFRLEVNRKYSLNLKSYKDLHTWSVNNIEAFASAFWVFVGIKYHAPPTRTIDDPQRMFPPPKWFPGATMNFSENLLCTGLAMRPDAVAVTAFREGLAEQTELTYAQLETRVAVWANALRKLGVQVGDRVATVLTNSIDSLLVILATGAVGAIFSSAAPDMGPQAIMGRYSQLRPKILVCETSVTYGGKIRDFREKISQVHQGLQKHVPEFQQTIVVRGPMFAGSSLSGTTGPPKCITHAAGRALLQNKKEFVLHYDVGPYSTFYQYTTTGWMMWNFMIAGLSIGMRIVLYDGSPLYPSPANQIDLVRSQGVTHWSTGPKFLSALKQHSLSSFLDLDSLETVVSAGAPLSAELSRWFYTKFPKNVALSNGSGGTDLVGGIVLGTPMLNIHAGEISGAALGMKVEIWDENGKNIEDSGEKGDLVITRPFFSMPLGFWGPDGAAKFKNAYFEQFPGVWAHGDFIKKNLPSGGYEVLGRSDGVLNPGGIRFGTAELYGVVDTFPEIEDCIAVGQKIPKLQDERVLMFVKLAGGRKLSGELRQAIKTAIMKSLSPRHVPAEIFQVADIPYTINGKKIENIVRDIVSGREELAPGTVTNPECLAEYKQFAVRETQAKL